MLLLAMFTTIGAWSYTITKNVSGTGTGTVTVTVSGQEVTSANAGSTVTVTIEANDPYIVKALGLRKENNEGMYWNSLEETQTRRVFTFEMPESNVIVDATFGRPTHSVYGVEMGDKNDNVIIRVMPDCNENAEVGSTVTLTVTLGTGIVLNSLTAMTVPSFEPGVQQTAPVNVPLTKVNDKYTFTMPDADVRVDADYYKDAGAYTISTSGTDEHTSIIPLIDFIPVRSANKDEVVQLSFISDNQSVPTSVTVKGANDQSVTVERNDSRSYSFTMPAQNVTVSAVYGLAIELMTDGYGGVTCTVGGVEATAAKANDVVTLTLSPNSGYSLASLGVYYDDEATYAQHEVALTKQSETVYTFTMPSCGVKVRPRYAIALYDNAVNDAIMTVHNDEYTAYMLSGRTLYRDGSWNTLCLPFDIYWPNVSWDTSSPLYGAIVKELDASASNLSKEGVLTLKFKDAKLDSQDNIIQAGKPYIVKWNAEENLTNITNPVFNTKLKNTEPVAVEFAIEGSSDKCQFVGQYSPFTIDANNIKEVLYVASDNKIGYSSKARTLKCFRSHFYIPTNGGQQQAHSFVLDFGDNEIATGISTTNLTFATPHSDKSENFTNSDTWFTIDGRKLDKRPTTKGIYINNGKKTVIK